MDVELGSVGVKMARELEARAVKTINVENIVWTGIDLNDSTRKKERKEKLTAKE